MNDHPEPMDEQTSPDSASIPKIKLKLGENTGIQSSVFDLCHSVPYGADFESNFCDFVELTNAKIRVVIGEIVVLWKLIGDHIVEPDILRKIKPTIRQFLESETEVSDVTDKLNTFFAGMKNELMVTCLVLQIDPNSTDVQIVNAGSEYPLFGRKSGQVEVHESDSNIPLGIVKDERFKTSVLQLEHGEAIVLFTEWLVNKAGLENSHPIRNFLKQRLKKPINSAENFCGEVMEKYNDLCGEYRYGDATLICIRRVD